jgi:hypothetical protein
LGFGDILTLTLWMRSAPLASLPVEIAGRNRMQRELVAKLIEMDPEWKKGGTPHSKRK